MDEQTGRVNELWLRANGLKRGLPDAIGLLTELCILDLEGNTELRGFIPAALGNLPSLHTLWLDDCGIRAPAGASLRCSSREEVLALFKAVGGSIAAKDRPLLAVLFDKWDGLHWYDRSNWCSSRPLAEWHGVTTTEPKTGSSRVATLYLGQNGLSGRMHDAEAALEGLNQLRKLR